MHITWIIITIFIEFILTVGASCTGCDPAATTGCSAGQCTCLKHVVGPSCTAVERGYYVPDLDLYRVDPVESTCKLAVSSTEQVRAGLGEVTTVCSGDMGSGPRTIRFATFDDREEKPTGPDYRAFRLVFRHLYNGGHTSLPATLSVRPGGDKGIHTLNKYKCPLSPDETTKYNLVFQKENGLVFTQHRIHRLCSYTFDLTVTLPDEKNFTLILDSLLLIPRVEDFLIYKNQADSATKNEYISCWQNHSVAEATVKSPACETMTFSVMSELLGQVHECKCHDVGSESPTCHPVGGQCPCKPGVVGRTCDHCLPSYHQFSDTGCTACANGRCHTFSSHDALIGVITVVLVSLVAIFSLILIMFLPTSKYGRLCACYDEDKKLEQRKSGDPDSDGLKIQRTYSVRGNLESYVNITMAPIGLQQDHEPPKSEQMSGFKRRDSNRSLGPFVPANKTATGPRAKGRNKTQAQGGPKTGARMGSGLGAVGM